MTRIAFVMNPMTLAWQGGVNQVRNLVHALRQVPETGLEPVLVVSPRTPAERLAGLQDVETVHSSLLERSGRALRRGAGWLTRRDLPLEALMRSKRIDLMSHFEHLGASRFPVLGWIPDFQHRRLPGFFSAAERESKDAYFTRTLEHSRLVLVSSHDAASDLRAFAPAAAAKARVLHFVSGHSDDVAPQPLLALQQRFGFDGHYFLVPNQFWAHKNHRLVIDALARLKAAGTPQLVLATGATDDFRHPGYFDELMRQAQQAGVGDCFRALGLVPYNTLIALMRHAVAVINPSLFEGWSTSVEECRSLGLRVLLSDIAVHREQDPPRGLYFPADDAEALAAAMRQVWQTHRDDAQAAAQAEARLQLARRFREFGRAYADIVDEALGRRRSTAAVAANA